MSFGHLIGEKFHGLATRIEAHDQSIFIAQQLFDILRVGSQLPEVIYAGNRLEEPVEEWTSKIAMGGLDWLAYRYVVPPALCYNHEESVIRTLVLEDPKKVALSFELTEGGTDGSSDIWLPEPEKELFLTH